MNHPPDTHEPDRLLRLANPVDERLLDPRSRDAEALFARLSVRLPRKATGAEHGRRRRWLPATAAAVLLVIGGAAYAAATRVPWWRSGEPPVNSHVVDRQLAPQDAAFPPAADRTRARTVARANGAALVASPVGDTGYCLIPSLSGSPDLGFSCVYEVDDPKNGDGDEFRSYARPVAQGEPRWILYGRVTDPRAGALDLSEAAGTPLTVPLEPGGFFLAEVPRNRWSAIANRAGKGRILDGAGSVLRSGCVNWGPSPEDGRAGIGRFGFWTDGPGPCRPRPVAPTMTPIPEAAEKLVEATLHERFSTWDAGTSIALWRAPTREGGECIYLAEASATTGPETSRELPGGGTCTDRPRPAEAFPAAFQLTFAWTSLHGRGYSLVLHGRVDPALDIAAVALRGASGERRIPFANGYILTQLPNSRASGELPPGGPYALVAYDAAGTELASQDLQRLLDKIAGARR